MYSPTRNPPCLLITLCHNTSHWGVKMNTNRPANFMFRFVCIALWGHGRSIMKMTNYCSDDHQSKQNRGGGVKRPVIIRLKESFRNYELIFLILIVRCRSRGSLGLLFPQSVACAELRFPLATKVDSVIILPPSQYNAICGFERNGKSFSHLLHPPRYPAYVPIAWIYQTYIRCLLIMAL